MNDSFRSGPFGVLSVGLLTLLSLALPAPVRAQADQQTFGFGTHALRRILHDTKFKALNDWDELGEEPDKTLLVLLGHPYGGDGRLLLERIPKGLRNFVGHGGAVLLATDEAIPVRNRGEMTQVGWGLSEVVGTTVTGIPVSASPPGIGEFVLPNLATQVDRNAIYRDSPDCIFVEALREQAPSLFILRTAGQSAFRGLATNRPSYLRPYDLPAHAQYVATFPVGCRYGASDYLTVRERPMPFAARSEYGKGRMLLLADHSVFINEMMLPSDNSNVDFAYNAIDWLKGDNKERNRVLFVYDGKIETKLDIPIREDPISLLDVQGDLVDQANARLLQLEAKTRWKGANRGVKNAVEQASRALFGYGWGWWNALDRILVLFGVIGTLFYGLNRLLRASFRTEPHVPLFATAATRHTPSASVLQQRYRHAVQEDNLGDYAHVLAQEWLGSIYQGDGPPRVLAEGGWWHRRSLRNLVERVWQLAQADVPERMSQGEFRSFLADLESLRKALADGSLRLE